MYQIKNGENGNYYNFNSINTDPEEEIFRWCILKSSEIVSELGKGHRETIYHKAFEVELKNHHIPFESEKVIPIIYKGFQIGFGRADVVINNKIILEFKAVSQRVNTKDVKQLKKYMEYTGITKGIVINFGKSSNVNGLGIDFIYCNKNDYIKPGK